MYLNNVKAIQIPKLHRVQ